MTMISKQQQNSRQHWIDEISQFSGKFSINAEKIEADLSVEISKTGTDVLLGHLRLCGVIPESYPHDSSAEKLYSKYTDIIIHEAYKAMGFGSLILKKRADVADVECVSVNYSFVADAKAFRLSRTAKNQKDFKVQAMDNWKHGKPYAMIVCPVYQLPSRTSQIYQQAASRSVLISTYTHLAVGVRYAELAGADKAIALFHTIFQTVEALNPSKSAMAYWQAVNLAMLRFDKRIAELWREEKIALVESIALSKEEALQFLAKERERIMRLSREDAIKEVLKSSRVDNRIQAVNKVADNGILNVE